MQTSVNYSIYVKSSYEDYLLIKNIFNCLYKENSSLTDVQYEDNEQTITIDYDACGGVYNAIHDVRLIKQVLKNTENTVCFEVKGVEDSDYGDFMCFYINYFSNMATISHNFFNIYEHQEDCTDILFSAAGKLKYFSNHEDLAMYLEEFDGLFDDKVSADTKYLICGKSVEGGKKYQKAQELGVNILSEFEFIARFCAAEDFEISEEDKKIIPDYESLEEKAFAELDTCLSENIDFCDCGWLVEPVRLEKVKEIKEKLKIT